MVIVARRVPRLSGRMQFSLRRDFQNDTPSLRVTETMCHGESNAAKIATKLCNDGPYGIIAEIAMCMCVVLSVSHH